MSLREQIYHIVEQLPESRLEDALHFMELFSDERYEIEDLWLLSSGELKRMNDTIDPESPVVDDWRSHLRDL
jgi:hypothetical protein